MIPKVEACLETLDAACARSTSSTAALRHSLLLEIYTNRGVGTEIREDEAIDSSESRMPNTDDASDEPHVYLAVVSIHAFAARLRQINGDQPWPPPSTSIDARNVIELFKRYVIPNYNRYPVCLVRGEGSYVWDAEGNRYLDFFPGWGCNLLGHCPEPVVRAVQEQVATLIHVPNTWYTEAQGQWAKLLSERSFGGQAFFCNSGTEANEAAIKLARLHTPKERYKIITFDGGFHGRTLGATAATAQPKYHEGLGPLMAGFVYAPFGDLAAVEQADRRRDRRDPGRADPGRRGRRICRPTGSCRACGKLCRRARPAADLRRSADRLRPHRANGSPISTSASRPT